MGWLWCCAPFEEGIRGSGLAKGPFRLPLRLKPVAAWEVVSLPQKATANGLGAVAIPAEGEAKGGLGCCKGAAELGYGNACERCV